MNSKLLSFLAFVMGASVGSLVTWKCIEKKYKQIAQEEIDSVKETYAKMRKDDLEAKQADIEAAKAKLHPAESEKAETPEVQPEEVKEYEDVIARHNYTSYSNNINEKGGDVMTDRPYVISPDEFGDYPDYETIRLTYYNDKVLTDEYNEIVDDIDDLIGEDSLNHFGEYEDDSVFVRNDALKVDYEILLDSANYSDIAPQNQVDD